MNGEPYLIPPVTNTVQGEITLPGSKSIALRQIAMAALSEGTTRISGIPPCDDTDAMLDCVRALGVSVSISANEVVIEGSIDRTGDVRLDARMSGASTRLLIGLAALRSGTTRIDGHPSLRVRTNTPLFKVLEEHGCTVTSADGGLPATIKGPIAPPDTLTIDGSLSSQYITALLVAAPYFATDQQHISISGSLVSKPYIDITLNEMAKRGIDACWKSESVLEVPAGYYLPGDALVEGDATAASYFAALATLHGGDITLTNLGANTCQGDYQFMEIMQRLGARIERTYSSTRILGPEQLQPLPQIDMNPMPDAALTLITLAPLLPAGGNIAGLSSLHHKECDRLECPAAQFRKLGIEVATSDASIIVKQAAPEQIRPHTLETYHDHRMAMAFSIIGSVTGTLSVDDAEVVNKTYPNYWKDYRSLIA